MQTVIPSLQHTNKNEYMKVMDMKIGSCVVTFHAPWVQSLKEKRMIRKSLIEKTKHKFNVSIAEVDTPDQHKILTIGFACVSNSAQHADEMVSQILSFMENATDAEMIVVRQEII